MHGGKLQDNNDTQEEREIIKLLATAKKEARDFQTEQRRKGYTADEAWRLTAQKFRSKSQHGCAGHARA